MDQKQNHRAPKLRYSQCVYQEDISAATPKVISFHKEDQVVEEKQSYAMVTGFLRVLVHMQNPEPKRLPLISSFAIKVATIAYQRYVMCAIGFGSLQADSIHRNLFPSTCFEMGLPSATRAEALGSYDQVDARPNRTSSDDEMAHFATALAQRDQPLIVLAPGKMAGVDGLLAWLVDGHKLSYTWEHTDHLHRMRYSRVCSIALWMVYNSVYMGTSLDLPKS